jgi:hypothetical protein
MDRRVGCCDASAAATVAGDALREWMPTGNSIQTIAGKRGEWIAWVRRTKTGGSITVFDDVKSAAKP